MKTLTDTITDMIPSDCLLCGKPTVLLCSAQLPDVARPGRHMELSYGVCEGCIDPESQAEAKRRLGRLVEVPEIDGDATALSSTPLEGTAGW